MTTGWERLATFEGGTVAGMARAQAADGSWHVFAATPVGVFRSVDRGHSWAPLGVGARVAGAQVVAASPRYAEDGIVYAGAHDGVYRLDDPSGSWQLILTQCMAHCIALDAGDRDARPDGGGLTVFVGTEDDGILVSRNGGRSWEGANAGLLDLSVYDLALSPAFAEDGIAFAATGDGLYRTRNGGEAWRQLDTDTNDLDFHAVSLSPAFAEDRVVLAASYGVGLFRSEDGGRSWSNIGEADRRLLLDGDVWSLAQDECQSSVMRLPGAADSASSILLGVCDLGLRRSDDGGATWQPSSRGLTATLTATLTLSLHFGSDHTIYAPIPSIGVGVSRDGGETWAFPPGPPEEGEPVRPTDDPDKPVNWPRYNMDRLAAMLDPSGRTQLLGATVTGLYRSDDDGVSWVPVQSTSVLGESVEVAAVAQTAHGAHYVTAITTDTAPRLKLVGSRDGGQTRAEISVPVADAVLAGLALAPGSGLDGALYLAVVESAGAEFTLWYSADGGRRWQQRFVHTSGGQRVASPICALPANPWDDTVVMALGSRALRPRPNAWETKGGMRRPVWDAVELPGAIASLAASPAYAQDRTLFAATSAGVFVSRDGGATFLDWNDGLDPPNCVAVAVSPAYAEDRLVYALGLGGTIWRRTDA
ncbi:MAG: hypothetical protein IT306_18740 [Chloroflexi bacterium]|nr:hypothetical protein [Chloroflexota bacterium]